VNVAEKALPKHTKAAWNDRLASPPYNLSLILDKLQPWEEDPHSGIWSLTWAGNRRGGKGQWLLFLASKTKPDDQGYAPRFFPEKFRQHWVQRSKTLVESRPHIRRKMIAVQRHIVGLGSQTTLETTITLDRCSGLPYIPGSAQKGLARSIALYKLAEKWKVPGLPTPNAGDLSPLEALNKLLETQKEKLELSFNRLREAMQQHGVDLQALPTDMSILYKDAEFLLFRRVFGCGDNAGEVIFYDAPPANNPQMAVEIMNPHFPKYYEKKSFPTDNQNPIPVPYLVVEKGSAFWFAVGARIPSGAILLQTAWAWLSDGLLRLGIGAKTSSGMGIFREPVK